VGQVDLLLAALAEELLDLIAAIGKGGGLKRSWLGGFFCNLCGGKGLTTLNTKFTIRSIVMLTATTNYLRM
jgi:hypothetical protein